MADAVPSFIHLRVRSSLSILESMIRPKALADWAVANDAPAVGVTDDNNLFAALELSEGLAGAGVQPLTGVTLRVSGPDGQTDSEGELALFAQTHAGYLNLMALSSKAFLAPGDDGPGVGWADVLAAAEDVICLTGGEAGAVTQHAAAGRLDEARSLLDELSAAFGDRLYVELQRHNRPGEDAAEARLVDLAYEMDLPLVATNDARFLTQDQYGAHDALMCIGRSAYLNQDDRDRATPEQYLKSPEEMAVLFGDLPEALENTIEIAKRCAFRPGGKAPILPNFTGESGDEGEELVRQAKEGLAARLDGATLYADEQVYWDRLEFELNVIRQMGFPGYFLIVADFIKWAKDQDIPVGPGRGSGAGSVVAWALTITDLDPMRFGLLFERFLNPERVSMPDFDIDFCQDRRGEVIQYVRDKYGEDRVAHIITFGTLQARAVLRDVGRVMQLPFGQVDRLAKLVPFNPANPPTLAEAIEGEPKLREARSDDEDVRHLIDTSLALEGLNRNASTHAAGVVIGDRPLVELAPLYKDPKSELPATQFNMKWAEFGGLVKFDFLGLKTLTVIQRALAFVDKEGKSLTPEWETFDNKAAYDMLSTGQALGVFQMESQGMRDTLKKVQPDCIEDIIALISLYRPGPMKNIDTFVDRKYGRAQPDYLHPDLEPVLKETYGVIVYQEQVMQIAQILAGYSLGEADLLRRAMGKKKPEEMAKQKKRFLEGAERHGVSNDRAEYIFELVNEFAGYGFNKSHAAAYAVIAYQTAYLKANHPVEFLAASMSLDIQNTDKLAAFFQETKRLGISVAPPDITSSNADFDVRDQTIFYALGAVKGVGKPAMASVERARGDAPFNGLHDFAERVDARLVNKRVFESLAKAGAFDALEPNRGRAFAAANILAATATSAAESRASNQVSLFDDEPAMRAPLPDAAPWSESERLDNELASVGFYLSGHPLDDVLAGPARDILVLAAEREEVAQGRASFDMIGMVRARIEKPAMSGGKFAYVTLSDPSGEYEVMAPPEVLAETRDYLEVGSAVKVRIKARKKDEEIRLSIDAVKPLETATLGAPSGLFVRVGDTASLPQLSEIMDRLARDGKGPRGEVSMEVPLDDGRLVTVRLDGRYPVDYAAMAALKSTPGVDQVRPVG